MALETGSYINDLVKANPPGTDPKSQGDDHLRLIKTALKNCFPGFTGSVIVGGNGGGIADVYTLSPSNALPAYTANTMVAWLVPATNLTTAPTINISALGARQIKAVNGSALQPGDLVAGQYVVMIDTGTEYRLVGITKNYVDNLVFDSSLPTPPPGNGPFYLVYENGTFGYATVLFPDFLLQAQGVI